LSALLLLLHRTPHGILRSLHNMMATNAEKVAAVVQPQNARHWSVLLLLLHDSAITAASAVVWLI